MENRKVLVKVATYQTGILEIQTDLQSFELAKMSLTKYNGLDLGSAYIPAMNIAYIIVENIVDETEKREEQRETTPKLGKNTTTKTQPKTA